MKYRLAATLVLLMAAGMWFWLGNKEIQEEDLAYLDEVGIEGRWEYQVARLADLATGEIPPNMRMRELAFAASLPRASALRNDSVSVDFESIGPYNVGGRTRAFAIDVTDSDTYLAGGVSGGIWKSTDAGQSWHRMTRSLDHPATSCLVQDVRPGATNTWYCGSGETVGNSASKSFSAMYRGSGIWKSDDGGDSWSLLQSTASLAHKASDWEVIHNMAIDPSRNDSDIVFAATKLGIMRSNDGGASWKRSLSSITTADFTRIAVTSEGVCYASVSSNAGGRGFFRSADGLNWVSISPAGLPASHDRTVIAIAPSDEDQVFWFSYTPGSGVNSSVLFHYNYNSGNGTGAGGTWTSRTSGMANTGFNLQGAYNMVLAVKPDDPNVVFLGGTNLYRSKNAFTDTLQNTRIGGYSIDGDTVYTYFGGGGKHYPDQQNLAFRPDNPNILISTTDAGVHLAQNCLLDTMQWVGLNNGYITSQFYGIAIDQLTAGSEVVVGGTQDRGTHWTNVGSPTHLWSHVRGADGAYCEIEDGAKHYYISTQYANIERCEISASGEKFNAENIMPKQLGRGGGAGWLFVHPFTLDKANNDILYLPFNNTVWRNTNITATDSVELFSDWRQIADVGSRITAIASSPSDEGIVYVGTTNGRILRLDNAHTFANVVPIPASDSIRNGGYTACIAVDPYDPMKAIAVFSNYNCRSLWYTEDGGQDWEDIEGNLVGVKDEGVPDNLSYIGNGPSIRWAEIVPTPKGNVVFIGTSVGVFSTGKLDGTNTEWVQQGENTIGNVVVDMLKYRVTDGWIVAGTHGNGMYAGNVMLVDTTSPPLSATQMSDLLELDAVIFPNPGRGVVYVGLKHASSDLVEITVFDQQGREVKHFKANGANTQSMPIDMDGMAIGTYFVEIRQGRQRVMKPLLIN